MSQVISFPSQDEERLDNFIAAARRIETALQQERERTKKLQDELAHIHATYTKLLSDSESKSRELSFQENRLRAAISQYQLHEKKIIGQARKIIEELKRTKAELQQYKSAWSEVLQREKEAKMIIADGEQIRRKADESAEDNKRLRAELEQESTRRVQYERHCRSYQKELQNALIRIHSAEAKFNELSKEYALVSQNKLNIEKEIERVERSVRERYQFELVKERERIKAEVEREAALERERFRQETRERLKDELEKSLEFERDRIVKMNDGLNDEIKRLKEALEESDRELYSSKSDANTIQEALSARVLEAEGTVGRLQAERLELLKQIEAYRPRAEKADSMEIEIERLRSDLSRTKQDLSRVQEIYVAESKVHQERMASSQNQTTSKIEALEAYYESKLDALKVEYEGKLAAQKTELDGKFFAQRSDSEGKLAARESHYESRLKIERDSYEQAIRNLKAEQKKAHELLSAKVDGLEKALEIEVERSGSLEQSLVSEKTRFDEVLLAIRAELGEIHRSNPLREIQLSIDGEILRLEQRLSKLSRGVPLYHKYLNAIEELHDRREAVRGMIRHLETRLESLAQRMNDAMGDNTLITTAPDETL